ncbi:hypothetical protein [Hymenobacter fodinae]|uniref:Uncharacterized protein n=1 Tax=Hymenobacter fodinae TaxID=2510796 RepID=A0A4Z0P5Y9_9BACT|nr:hypothetical protein [Hymenobacter fodinae]TGE07701.1 hypothetical protein EU556_08075 [Hymenobacter fodinae]
MSQMKGEWVDRARQIKLAGLSRTESSELAAVHAALYPAAEPVRVSCYKCVAEAFQAILRYLRTTSTDSSTSFPTVMSTATPSAERKYSFTDKSKTYRPHNSPVVFSNENLTDARVAMILKADPAAAVHFGISEDEGQAFVAEQAAAVEALKVATESTGTGTTTTTVTTTVNPLANEQSDEYKAEYAKLDGLKREELDALYTDEVKEGDAKSFPNKGELIKALLAFRAK